MKRKQKRRLAGVLVLGAIACAVWWLWPRQATENTPLIAVAAGNKGSPDKAASPAVNVRPQTATQDAPARKAERPTSSSDEAAAAAYKAGADLFNASRFVEARSKLSKAYYSGKLSLVEHEQARLKLTQLAETTLIGRLSTAYPDDPYAFRYEFQPGEKLLAVEKKLDLHVPWQMLVRVNGLSRPEDIQAGKQYKMIRGPFHAVVYNGTFEMDLHLQREGLEKVFIKRVRIGTGKNGSTPVGMWRVKVGGKNERPTWYPPPNSVFRGPIPYGHPNYAFGLKGLWIGLEGTDQQTSGLADYGLHSTNDPASIGQAKSLGCIRLGDEDIELVYQLLYEKWSTVEVRP